MAEVSHPNDSNPPVTYAFRFASSDQLLHLTQQQIDLIPYLSILMTHKNDFLSIENENGEYVLSEPIEYPSFMAILRSISSQNPYKLLDELPEDENVFDILQLFDYLGLPSFPLPLLRYANLVRSKPVNNKGKNQRIKYHQASLPEVRRTAGEFVIALAKNEYKLSDSKTMDAIFNLLNIIVFNAGVFNLRFRDYTLTIAKKRCYSFFSKTQRRELESSHRLPQYEKINSNKFWNTFSWRGVYVPIEDNHTDLPSSISYSSNFGASILDNRLSWSYNYVMSLEDRITYLSDYRSRSLIFLNTIRAFNNNLRALINSPQAVVIATEAQSTRDERKILISELKRNPRKEEAQSARSGRFNTSSAQIKVDKFKHRCGPKVQKYR